MLFEDICHQLDSRVVQKVPHCQDIQRCQAGHQCRIHSRRSSDPSRTQEVLLANSSLSGRVLHQAATTDQRMHVAHNDRFADQIHSKFRPSCHWVSSPFFDTSSNFQRTWTACPSWSSKTRPCEAILKNIRMISEIYFSFFGGKTHKLSNRSIYNIGKL